MTAQRSIDAFDLVEPVAYRPGEARGRAVDVARVPRFARAPQPSVLFGSGAFREWLISNAFDEVMLPHWPGAGFWAYRNLVSCVLSALPDCVVRVRDVDLAAQLNLLWPGQVCGPVGRAARPEAHLGVCEESAIARDAVQNPLQEEIEVALNTLRAPESVARVEARLLHLRETAARPVMKPASPLAATEAHADAAYLFGLGSAAANAIIPEARPNLPAGLHLGAGLVLGPGRTNAGFQITRLDARQAEDQSDEPALTDVPFDPRPGKVLKHETAHALYLGQDGRVRVALSALTMIGLGARHQYFRDASHLPVPTALCFIFNESWSFVGMGTARVAIPGQTGAVIVSLRTGAIWDDLVAMADLGCGASADTLASLEQMREALKHKAAGGGAPLPKTRLASPARVGGDR